MKIRVIDDLPPEDLAMLQALYSRSAESVDVHLEKVRSTGSGKFMEKYYVGYSHKSIADCGSTTVFIENVSMLAAKAIQDWPLYSGQETSSRYVDMSTRRVVNPIGSPASRAIIDRWMAFYTAHQPRVAETVRARHPARAGERPSAYEGAVKARTFDIMRGFLPAGIATQLSWHTNLRQASDHLIGLACHPAFEVAQIATALRGQLADRYSASGFESSLPTAGGVRADARTGNTGDADDPIAAARSDRSTWEAEIARDLSYSACLNFAGKDPWDPFVVSSTLEIPDRYAQALRTRPRGCVLPHVLSDLGQVGIDGLIDFGSFRDLQRHRNGVCRMPLLTTSHGFDPWYLEQLDDDLRVEAGELIARSSEEIDRLDADPVAKQYYVALGYRVPYSVTFGLPALLYVLELRSGKHVHPTLRHQIHKAIRWFRTRFPEIALHVDMDPDDWTVRRGEQTITERARP